MVLFNYTFSLIEAVENSKFLLGEFKDGAWQKHLQRISDFLVCDEGVWWKTDGKYVVFHDGDEESISREEGPVMQNFHDNQIIEVCTEG